MLSAFVILNKARISRPKDNKLSAMLPPKDLSICRNVVLP